MIVLKKQNFLKGSVILMLSVVVAKVLGALFKIPLTNILGGVGMGYFSTAYSIFMPVYALSVTGLSSAVARMTAQSEALGMHANTQRVRRVALALFSGVGLAGSLIILIFAKPLSIYSAKSSQAWLAVAMIAPSVLFGCVTAVERGYYEGRKNMYPTAISQAVEGVVKVLAGLSLCAYVQRNGEKFVKYFPDIEDVRAISASAGILGVTLSSLGALIFFAIMGIFSDRETGGDKTLVSRRKIARELVANALPTGISSLVTNLTALIDMWTVIACIRNFEPVHGISSEEMPQFIYGSFAGIALTVFNLVPSVTNMLGKGILPCITEAWESGDRESLKKNTEQALFTCAVICVPTAFGIGVLSREILLFLFSRQTDEAEICVNALRLLMPGMVSLCISFPMFSMLQAVGKFRTPVVIMLTGAVVKLAGNLILIPLMGVDGAGLSTSVCYVVILAISVFEYFRYTGVKADSSKFFAVIYSGLMCGASAFLTADICRANNFSLIKIIMITALVGGMFYIISLVLSGGVKFGSDRNILIKNTGT